MTCFHPTKTMLMDTQSVFHPPKLESSTGAAFRGFGGTQIGFGGMETLILVGWKPTTASCVPLPPKVGVKRLPPLHFVWSVVGAAKATWNHKEQPQATPQAIDAGIVKKEQ